MDTYTVDLESMGKRIRELRNTQNKTQEVFADMIHISSSYLALIEQGKRTANLDVVAQVRIPAMSLLIIFYSENRNPLHQKIINFSIYSAASILIQKSSVP